MGRKAKFIKNINAERMKSKQSELGQIIIDISSNAQRGKAVKAQSSLYDMLKAEKGSDDNSDIIENVDDDKSKKQSAVLRKTLRFCMKHQEINLADISASIDISKNKIINFLKNRNKNLLKDDEKRRLRGFLKKQMVR